MQLLERETEREDAFGFGARQSAGQTLLPKRGELSLVFPDRGLRGLK